MEDQDLFHAQSSIKDGESHICWFKWELMQEIHHVWYWKELETNLYLVSITISKTRNKLTLDQNFFQAPFSIKGGVSHIRVFT